MLKLISVDVEAKVADCQCTECGAENKTFPLAMAATKTGDGFVISSKLLRGCTCDYVTVFPVFGDDPISQALTAMAGF